MGKHTPGPWGIIKWQNKHLRIVPRDAYGNSRGDGPIADVFYNHGEQEANARLIAKAPDQQALIDELVEALRDVVGYLGDSDGDMGANEREAHSEALNLITKTTNR